jgi:hypothetical protein
MAKKVTGDATEQTGQPADTGSNTVAPEAVASETASADIAVDPPDETAGAPGESIQGDGQSIAPVAVAEKVTEAAPVHATSTLSAAAQVISSSATEADPTVGLTKVLIEYPEGYEGDRFYETGTETHVEPTLAERFVDLGIATIIE